MNAAPMRAVPTNIQQLMPLLQMQHPADIRHLPRLRDLQRVVFGFVDATGVDHRVTEEPVVEVIAWQDARQVWTIERAPNEPRL